MPALIRRFNGAGLPSIEDFDKSERVSIERPERVVRTYGPSKHRDGSVPYAFVPVPWSEVDSVSYSACDRDRAGGWVLEFVHSDYSGSTYDAANMREWMETYPRKAGDRATWVEVSGSHGTRGIAIAIGWLLSPAGRDAYETLAGLGDSALISDDSLRE